MAQPARDLTSGSMVRNLWALSLPIMFSNFIQTFYNLTDTFWLGKLGASAKTAVSAAGIAFPLIFFLASFGAGFVVAGTAMVARYRGADEVHKIPRVLGQFTLIMAFFAGLVVVIGLGFMENILTLLHTPPEVMDVAQGYLKVILVGSAFMFFFLFYQSVAHGWGDTISPMYIQLISVMINVVLDPLLIFGWGFFPRLEVIGAAYATLFARVVAVLIAVFFIQRRYKMITPRRHDFQPDFTIIKNIFRISIPASISQSITSFGFLLLQGFVNSFGTMVISANSIGNRITGFFMMPAMGISNALAAIVGQNLGAHNVKRAEQSFWIALRLIMGIMLVGSALTFFFGGTIVKFFIDAPDVVETGARMFRISSLASFIFGALFTLMGVFNGAGDTVSSMIFNISRLWCFRIPLVFLLSGEIMKLSFFRHRFWQPFFQWLAQPLSAYPYDALWWSMVISNFLATTVAFIIFFRGSWKHKRID